MLCNQCGSVLPDDATFCNNCGAPVAQPQQPQYLQGDPIHPSYNGVDPEQERLSKSILTMGILSLALGWLIAALGVIFGGISLGKSNAYAQKYPLVGRAKVGRILGIIGMIIGIINGVLGIIIVLSNS